VIRNNLGGHYNHSLFWTLLKPNAKGAPNAPAGKLEKAITEHFKSFDNFKKEFAEAAMKIFGSGWCWLIIKDKKLQITTTPNQDNPLMKVAAEQGAIVLALDVWEHAYYLKHQNKRADYITAWWNVVNWEKAQELFENH
jgi:Fe-Mn family superoxide dismutase